MGSYLGARLPGAAPTGLKYCLNDHISESLAERETEELEFLGGLRKSINPEKSKCTVDSQRVACPRNSENVQRIPRDLLGPVLGPVRCLHGARVE